ncbi:hypothetical protein BOX15_Mlig017252g3 [Macrostomum lignano]|uniref:Uncharacterized protein n=1 Tax=Macrostomum lignano TaxID=282301 RepID=A0A267GAG0_9PLAT|nr:hypothetical protein BOX15_Mlig017252g3 [Macrostomum lignano]
MTRSKVIDLAEVIEDWAKDFYQKFNQRDLEKSYGMKLPFQELRMVIDTNNFCVDNDEAEYSTVNPGTGQWQRNHVLFKTSYSNTTATPMQYALSTQRSTRSVCSVSLSKGFVFEGQSGLKVSLPNNLLELSASMSRQLSMEGRREKSVEQELAWTVDTTVSVPPGKTVTVRLVIKERQFTGTFRVATRFRGSLAVKLFRGDSKLCVLRANELRDVFKENLGFQWQPEEACLLFISEGQCHTACGVEQFIQIDETDFEATDSEEQQQLAS